MMGSFVLDASVAMAWCFQEEATPATMRLLDRMGEEVAVVPGLWFLELTNVLMIAERKKRATPAQIDQFICLIEGCNIEIDEQSPRRAFNEVLQLSRKYGLSSYGASYLDLALRRKLPLASLDCRLAHAAKAAGLKVLGQ